MDWLIRNAVAALLMPPGCLLLIAACGLIMMRRRPRLGASLLVFAVAALYALSMPYSAGRLLQALEAPPRDPLGLPGGEAIVVLGADTYFAAPEYGGADTVSDLGLVRVRYAAYLYRATRKPLLLTGASAEGASASEAEHMRTVLVQEFHVPVAWIEGESQTTFENAMLSYNILSPAGIHTIYLVTHAWHMPRAKLAFEHAGFAVIPAATGYATRFRLTVLDFLPNARALLDTTRFFHEIIGIAWYRLKFITARWL